MKTKLIAAAIVAAVLISASVIAGIRANISEAGGALNTERRAMPANSAANPQADAAEIADARNGRIPYIGIAIARVPEDDDAADDGTENDGGALIVKVMAGSPADGNLQVDDVIAALDGDAIDGPRDVVAIVRDAEPGDTIVFSVRRGDADMDVSVTVGERAADDFAIAKRGYFGGGYFDEHDYDDDGLDGLILSETRRQTDEGVMTVRKAVGTVQSVDVARGVLNLLLADESETLSFTINEDTKVLINRSGSLGGLSATETTLVVEEIDAEGARNVEMVAQGDMNFGMQGLRDKDFGERGFGFPHPFMFGERDFDFPHFDFFDDGPKRKWHRFGWDDDRRGGERYHSDDGDDA